MRERRSEKPEDPLTSLREKSQIRGDSPADPAQSWRGRLSAQYMTVAPFFLNPIRSPRPRPPHRRPFRAVLTDPTRGSVPLIGDLYLASPERTARRLNILIHGISSTHKASYLSPQLRESLRAGSDALSISLRGAVGEGIDHYHAGLSDDLHALFRDARLADYQEITVTGYSLGGLVSLCFASECRDPRLGAVAAICPPLDLGVVQDHLDQPQQRIYRSAILSTLRRDYFKIWRNARAAGVPLGPTRDEIRSIRSFKAWDEVVVLSRFPFQDQSDYHQQVSMSTRRFTAIERPTLIYLERNDPMIPFVRLTRLITPLSEGKWPLIDLVVGQGGGHLGFSSTLRLNDDGEAGLAPQLERWFHHQLRA
ncbi:MAG: alpha/beta fold hydrolase [Myxococcota bacterium]|nr:alpha/beta fold hydrolase [Myxococcota bacterium]